MVYWIHNKRPTGIVPDGGGGDMKEIPRGLCIN